MKICYDFHIHSALSPCANDDMTPLNIVAMAAVKGLNAIAVADHNSIKNVRTALECADVLGVVVIPAVEVQTSEEIHILCLFESYEKLETFYEKLEFPYFENDENIFGNQLIIDSDDNVVAKEKMLLSVSSNIGVYQLTELVIECGGLAIAAHIDREANGILAILGDIPEDLNLTAIEFSKYATSDLRKKYSQYKQVTDSDAHQLESISDAVNSIAVDSLDISGIFNYLRGNINGG